MRIISGWAIGAAAGVIFGAQAQEVPLRDTPQGRLFGTERFAVRLDAQTGWAGEVLCDGKTVVRAPDTAQSFDLKRDEKWVTGGGTKIEGLGVVRVGPDTVKTRMRAGDWSVEACLQIFPQERMLRRWFEVTWLGSPDTQVKGFWFRNGVLPLGGAGGYFLPAQYPPRRIGAKELVAEHRTHSWRSPNPVVAETGDGWSAVWVSDESQAYSDRANADVTEGVGQVRVVQSFSMQGHMRRGVTQTVGDAWLWLQPNDAETALRRMGEWFRFVGQVPPVDRPDWLKHVILYSFHPGGTIGSQCKDLGGFQAATEFLPHIRELGCNAIWLMPLEDKSIYWPRDYYKFQEGLGTPDDYKALTARAHALGMRVWQDCVPHGGGNECPRAKEHPEWLAQNEDGSTLSYWCFDFNWPTWIDYMSGVVSFYTREYALDGFRIDAVSGSKIPNWNPAIPYARASHAQAQGGLAMQRALRASVRAVRPDGANLAEAGESIHGTVSDSTYDFDLCYNVLHDFRKLPAEEFVPRLRRWLHEQQCAEVPDLVRMRHVESHDSLRSGLWYGADAQRALVALISWIHGIPMVYHEMEDGNYDVYRKIFQVRSRVAELSDGAADYLAVTAPDGVFACLRSTPDSASVVLVNLSGRPVSGAVSVPAACLPEALRATRWARDVMTGAKVTVKQGQMGVSLAPFGYTVLHFGGEALPELKPFKTVAPAKPVPAAGAAVRVKAKTGSLLIDSATGFATAWESGWRKTVPLEMDLALPKALSPEGTDAVRVLADGSVEAVRAFGGRTLTVKYSPKGDGVDVRAKWEGGVPEGAALMLGLPRAERWFATTAEGAFESPFRVRHPGCDGVVGSIYRLPQGTAVVWDSRLHPFGLDEAHARVGSAVGGRSLMFGFAPERLPAAVQILDRVGDDHGMKVLVTWRQEEQGVSAGSDELVFTLQSGRMEEGRCQTGTGDARLTEVGGGWAFENAHYRATVGRNGVLLGLWRRVGAAWQPAVRRSRLYTDKGFEGDKALSQENDVEARARIERIGDAVKLSFCGELRGFNRFDKMAHPIRFYSAYTFGTGEAFRRVCAFKTEAFSSADFAFVSLLTGTEGTERVAFADAAGAFLTGERGDGKSRYAQTAKSQDPRRLPAEISLFGTGGCGLRLADLSWLGVKPANVFMQGGDLHLAWMDGKPDNGGVGRWNGVSMSVSCGASAVAPPEAVPLASGGGAEVLRNGDFEESERGVRVLARSGRVMPQEAVDQRTAWRYPKGAESVVEGGSRCAMVEGDGKEYRLIRQLLPVQTFAAGSVWRLTARMRAQGVERADMSWKTACLRWGLYVGERFSYSTASLPVGDSDWREVSVEMTAPAGLTEVSVEAGMNGNAGRVWIDDVVVTRLETANKKTSR